MKRLFLALSFLAIVFSLSSCGAEEVCRPRGGYTQVINQQQNLDIVYYQATIKENK